MSEQLITGANARWEVIWWSKKGKRFIVKDFSTDFRSALDLYMRVKRLEAPLATLRSCNVAFPPEDKYRDRMQEVNLKGLVWCPYCVNLRRFRKQDGFLIEGNYVGISGWYCPVCEISHRDFSVRRYNPVMANVYTGRRRRAKTLSAGKPTRDGRKR